MSTEALPAGATDEGRVTLMQHLVELRRRVMVCCLGAVIAYWPVPNALQWLADSGGNNITQAYTADKYYQLIAYMMLEFGICFEFPILLVFLQLAGIVQNQTLRKYWRHSIVGIAVVVPVATPTNHPSRRR